MLRDYHRHGRLIDGGRLEDAEASASRAWLADTLARIPDYKINKVVDLLP